MKFAREWQSNLRIRRAILLLLVIIAFSTPVGAQSPNSPAELVARINQERITRGLIPYALSEPLTAAAQAHANDMSQSGKKSHTGSDGSDVFTRVARAGYGKYTWGYRVGENWASYHDIATAMQMWMNSAPHRENILHTLYREVGVGIAPGANGALIYVIVFGAQPNILPVFINDGAAGTASSDVTLRLGDEQVAASGEGSSVIGHPTEMQISNEAGLAGAQWRLYVATVSWTLAPGNGTRTVYVKYRDVRGRTAGASDSIILGTAALDKAPAAAASRTPTRTPRATVTLTRTPRPTATRTHTPLASATPTELPTATDTPAPTLTVVDTPAPAASTTPGLQVAYRSGIASLPGTPAVELPAARPSSAASLLALGLGLAAVALGVLALLRFITHRV